MRMTLKTMGELHIHEMERADRATDELSALRLAHAALKADHLKMKEAAGQIEEAHRVLDVIPGVPPKAAYRPIYGMSGSPRPDDLTVSQRIVGYIAPRPKAEMLEPKEGA